MNFELKTVDRFPAWVCPHCGQHPDDKFDVLNRDTFSLDSGSFEFEKRADLLFWQLCCPECGKDSYLFELTLLAEGERQLQFVVDGCWASESKAMFICSTKHEKWEHERLEEVTFDDGEKVAWLSIHRFGPFDDFNMGKLRVSTLVKEIAMTTEEFYHQ